ncbi:MAG: REP-associated tyrosine transposase [Acidobacteriota bacterium]|nr:REP-associated tyrosine transposase [Acidobacteriota bacterium]
MEVTTRTLQGRLLLRPSPELNELVVGVLGRAQRLYEVEIKAFAWVSNHFHLLVWAKTAKQLADFMAYLNSNTAREVARLTGWTEKVWGRRYQAIPVSEEEEAQVARLAYILGHGCKENLWPASGIGQGSTASGPSWTARKSSATGSTGARSTGLASGGRSTTA